MATQVADEKTVTGFANPMGTDGFEFVEYAAPDPELLRGLFTKMGFPAVAHHKRKNVTLHRQGDINFIINAEPDSFAAHFAAEHGPSACAMAFRVKDAKAAHDHAMSLGAIDVQNDVGEGELDIPAIEGIGGSDRLRQAVLQFEPDPLGGLLAHAGDGRQAPEVAAGDGAQQVVRRHSGEDHPRQPGADAVDPDQLLEQRLLALGPEAEEGDAVLPQVGVDEEADGLVAPLLDLVPGGEGDVDLVAHPVHVEQQALLIGPEEGALEIADHGRGL